MSDIERQVDRTADILGSILRSTTRAKRIGGVWSVQIERTRTMTEDLARGMAIAIVPGKPKLELVGITADAYTFKETK